MDLGPDPIDRDDVIQRHGRRLFVLAYHLTGDSAKADELCQECLVRSLLAPDFPASERDTSVFLHRGLISLWRERAALPGRAAIPRALEDAAASRPVRDHAALWRALSRLDPVSRAVLVLRVAEGLEYETIGKVLDMAPDVVYARLLQARGGLREGDRALETSLFETMNLYLDGRLPGDQRAAFERRMQTDRALRERVEFHRGLTLELHEEAPPMPRDFIGRLRERMEKARETLALVDQATGSVGWEPAPRLDEAGRGIGRGVEGGADQRAAPSGPRLPLLAAAIVSGLVFLAAGVGLGFWVSRRRPAPPLTELTAGPSDRSPNPEATPDEATVEALRSLGYLAPARDKPKVQTGKGAQDPAKAPKAASTPAGDARRPAVPEKRSPAPATRSAATPSRSPSGTPTPPASSSTPPPSSAAPPSAESATSAPTPAQPAPHETSVAWRAVPLAGPLDPARDRRTIRTAQEWAALFEGAPPPGVDFEKEMVVLLRDDPAGDPPVRLIVAAVTIASGALVIECRKEQAAAGAASAGQAIVVPISDLPIRVVVR